MTEKEYIARMVNKNCRRASCFVCGEADKYENYEDCPYIGLKQITREREVKAEDILDELVKSVNKGGAENGLCEKDQ